MSKIVTAAMISGLIVLATICNPAVVDAQEYYDIDGATMISPSISVTSPHNNTVINNDYISVIFNVSGPQVIDMAPRVDFHLAHIVKVCFKGDWQNETQILYFTDSKFNVSADNFLEFNVTLSSIPSGTHQLAITVEGYVYMVMAMVYSSEYYPSSNASIIFTVEQDPVFSPSSLIKVITAVTIATAVLIMLLYYYQRKRKLNK
ncbi:MAG: hypothetical protein NWE95_02985 [Candidatus Bathyarchaeota archaeon]|nr:hypothetical protein [Candidatus Bathyarchaeota archaeon]